MTNSEFSSSIKQGVGEKRDTGEDVEVIQDGRALKIVEVEGKIGGKQSMIRAFRGTPADQKQPPAQACQPVDLSFSGHCITECGCNLADSTVTGGSDGSQNDKQTNLLQ